MSALREIHASGWCVRLDLSQQVLELEAPHLAAPLPYRGGPAGALLVTPPIGPGPVSAATLLLKAKQFDDGLYAAVDLAAQRGAGRFFGKAALLRSLAATLADGPAAAYIHAACELGGVSVEAPLSLREQAGALTAEFLCDETASRPLGFYTWTPDLSAIFRQDRFLQQPLDARPADDLARTLAHVPSAAEAHNACLRLNARLTNPPAGPGLHDGTGRAFLPASRSQEQVLVERLFGDRPIPDGFDLITELINRVRSGEISLEPTAEAGWYDHQTWSLEPLIVPDQMPEAARLKLEPSYRKHLEALFRATLALIRETRVSQIAISAAGCLPDQQPIKVSPNLSVEPLPSLFARRAGSYRFVRSVLEEAFGPEALAGLHRLTQEGPCLPTLANELAEMEKLFDGAAAIARRELGMGPTAADEEAIRRFADWKAGLASDRDVGRDCRMMVPVFHDLQRRKTKVWAFLGWWPQSVHARYAQKPVVLGVEWAAQSEQPPAGPPPIEFHSDRYGFVSPVMAEVYVSRLLDRDEFRRHCDLHKTREAILAALD